MGTITIADEVHRRLKEFSAKRGQTLKWVLVKAIEEFLKKEEK